MCLRDHNKFAVSYGLIVKTKNNRIMLIRRKVPYCVQNYYIYLHQKKIRYDKITHEPFLQIRESFEKDRLPNLAEHDQLDYQRFLNGEIFEDWYDFPHGQMSHKRGKGNYDRFLTAYREFREETGFRFSFKKEDTYKYPIIQVEFKGCDHQNYRQYYFIVENVKGLRRCRYFDTFNIPLRSTVKIENWNDDRLVFESELMLIPKAFQILLQQQRIKSDLKHLLLKEIIPIQMELSARVS